MLETILTGVQTVSILLGILVAYITIRGSGDKKAADLAVMQRDIEYIKGKVDGLPDYWERLTKVEESAKQAHKRLDYLERRNDAHEN